MKKLILMAALFVSAAAGKSYAYETIVVQDSISSSTHWTADKQYLLKGYVYVTAGTILNIDPGTIIKGDKDTKGALIVERGARILAMGTATAPVVFTSNQPAGNRNYGDWGGVILCGKAPTNWNGGTSQVEGGPRSLYGGTDTHDNSGELHYVRIEFGGIAFSPNNEINGLTLCSVGDGTQVDHIQVSYSGDDSYEWFGGSVNAKYLVSLGSYDDDFDTDNGYVGKNQFCAVIRENVGDQSGSKAFESDSYQTGTATGLGGDTSQITKPVFSNCTIIGPLVNPNAGDADPNFVSAVHIRRGSSLSILNSIISGFPAGILIDESAATFGSTTANIASGMLQIRNTIVAGIPTNATPNPKELVYVVNGARSLTPTNADADTTTGSPFAPYAGPYDWFNQPAFGNKIYTTEQGGVRLTSPFTINNPNLIPTSTSPVVYNATHTFHPGSPINYDTTGNYANYNVPTVAPDFTNSKASDPFFDKVNFVGAFAGTGTTADNWTSVWCNFDPNNTDYSSVTTGITNIAATSTFANATAYPNPASKSATVALNVKQDGVVKIVALDVTGKTVATIFNGNIAAGAHQISFDIADLKAGLYIISITSDNKVQSLKLNVIK